MTSHETLKTASTGLFASIFTWFLGAIKWYAGHLQSITDVLVHVAQIGGLVVIALTIRKLWREGKSEKKSMD